MRKYTNADIRADPKLVRAAIEYARYSGSTFPPLVMARKKLSRGGYLTVEEVRKVVNTMRHDSDVASSLPEPKGSYRSDPSWGKGDDIAKARKEVIDLPLKINLPFVISDALRAGTIHLLDKQKSYLVFRTWNESYQLRWRAICRDGHSFPKEVRPSSHLIPTINARLDEIDPIDYDETEDISSKRGEVYEWRDQDWIDNDRRQERLRRHGYIVPGFEWISLYDAEMLIKEYGWRYCNQCRNSKRAQEVWDEINRAKADD